MEEFYTLVNQQGENLEKEALGILKLLDNEFRQLKFKAAKCAKKCFEEAPLPGAFTCEEKCWGSVQSVMKKVESTQRVNRSKFEKCIDNVSETMEGLHEATTDMSSGVRKCTSEYTERLKTIRQDIVREFSYYY